MAKCFKDSNGRECSRCSEYKLWSEYRKAKFNRDGFDSWCKSCRNDKYKQYQKEGHYKEAYKRNPKAYYNRNKRYIDKMDAGVYLIKTTEGNYVGQSKQLKNRYFNHKFPKSRTPVGGKEILSWEVLEYIDDLQLRLQREQYWIDKLKPELNTV